MRGTLALLLAVSFTGYPAPPASKRTVKRRPAAPVPAVDPQAKQDAAEFVQARMTKVFDSIENAAALVPFFVRLSNPPAGQGLHILQFGDSHTASDDWVNAMRQAVQTRFGNGGPGYVLPGRPFIGYRRFDVRADSSKGWQTEGTIGHFTDGRYGLGGVSLSTSLSDQTVSLDAECTTLKLQFLRQPDGGALALYVDGTQTRLISTKGQLGPASVAFTPPPGRHEFQLRTLESAPVKLFGWTADNPSGLTWETLGINGAQLSMMLDWDENILADHIAQREPALIILEYGTNEAVSPNWTAIEYLNSFHRVLDRLRRMAPLASILVIGAPDCKFTLRGGGFYTGHLSQIIEMQREIAFQHGAAFWDLRERMGGPGAIDEWMLAGYAQNDHVHLTSAGYKMVGDMLVEELMSQYRRFQNARAKAE